MTDRLFQDPDPLTLFLSNSNAVWEQHDAFECPRKSRMIASELFGINLSAHGVDAIVQSSTVGSVSVTGGGALAYGRDATAWEGRARSSLVRHDPSV